MPDLGLDPSFSNGYAASAGESDNPQMWDGLKGLWEPGLGYQGSKLFDASGYGNDGDLVNMTPQTASVIGKKGRSLNYAGGGEHVTGSMRGSFTDFTLMAWINPTSFTFFPGIVTLDSGVTDNGALFYVNQSTLKLTLWVVSSPVASTGENILTGVDTHVAVRRIGSTVDFFINGKLDSTASLSTTIPTITRFVIGAQNPTGFFFDGGIKSTLVYNKGIDDIKVRAHYMDHMGLLRLRQESPRFVSAGGGPVFNPAWALGSESVIGGPVFA